MLDHTPNETGDGRLPKLLVLLGPTASGKTDWSLKIAKKINGEIISADSRQIYKKMEIGTAQPGGEWKRTGLRKTYYVDDVPHHLINFLDPGKTFTAAEFRDKAIKYTKLARKNNRVPMLVGGTGQYISSVVDNWQIPRIKPNKKFRKSVATKSNEELLHLLRELDPVAAEQVDPNNTRRIVRALEVCIFSGEPFSAQRGQGHALFNTLQIGIDIPRDMLYERINERVDKMMKDGLLEEVKALRQQKYSWELPSMSGVGYRQFKGYFDGDYDLDRAVELLKRDTRRFARRQLTWFRRDKRIVWVKTYSEAVRRVEHFLSEK